MAIFCECAVRRSVASTCSSEFKDQQDKKGIAAPIPVRFHKSLSAARYAK